MIKEFKSFIMRGNVVDLAVGIIIGAAFGKIVTALINDIIMPPIGMLIGGINFKDFVLKIGGAADKPVTINYGNFIQITIEFVIIAFCVFLIVKGVNVMNKKEEAKQADPAPPSQQEEYLKEIRDLLKK
jgi:large conductance mechanosensitive channel